MSSPTQRTLANLRGRGYEAQVVEHWIPRARKRRDLWGVIDVLAMDDDTLLGVQATSDSNLSARRAKCDDSVLLKRWLANPGRRFELHGWGLRGKQGERKKYALRAYTAVLTAHGIVWTDSEGELWRSIL